MPYQLPEARRAQMKDLLRRLTRDYDTTPEPLSTDLIEFLERHQVGTQVTPDMVWAIEPQIEGMTETEISLPIYRKPNTQVDITPEAGPLPRTIEHYCLCPTREGEWFYLIVLFDTTVQLTHEQKIEKILHRLNESSASL